MSIPTALPDWLPWWAALAVLVPVLLYALAFLAMPFSVLGLKGRLESIEARLDEIQGEVRALALRLPERGMYLSEAPRPPIPPATARAAQAPERREPERREPERREPERREPERREPERREPERRPPEPEREAWQPTRPAARPTPAYDARGYDSEDPAPPDPSAAPVRRPLRSEQRREPPAPIRTPPRLDWPR